MGGEWPVQGPEQGKCGETTMWKPCCSSTVLAAAAVTGKPRRPIPMWKTSSQRVIAAVLFCNKLLPTWHFTVCIFSVLFSRWLVIAVGLVRAYLATGSYHNLYYSVEKPLKFFQTGAMLEVGGMIKVSQRLCLPKHQSSAIVLLFQSIISSCLVVLNTIHKYHWILTQ